MTNPTRCQVNTHGLGGYTNGCRCDTCRTGKANYMRARRAAGQALARRFTDQQGRYLALNITHGTVHGYRDAGCRCHPCTAAASAKRADERRRQRERTST